MNLPAKLSDTQFAILSEASQRKDRCLIAPKTLKTLEGGAFSEAFLDKGRLSPLLKTIPVKVILDERCALLGAAAYAEARAAEVSGRSERAASVTAP